MFGLEDYGRFSLPLVQPCPHGLNISLNALGRFHAIVAREQVLFNMLDFPPRERAEQIRLQRLILGVPPRYCTHSSTPPADQPVPHFWEAGRSPSKVAYCCINNTRTGRQIPGRKSTYIQWFTPFGARLNTAQRNLCRIGCRGKCVPAELQ